MFIILLLFCHLLLSRTSSESEEDFWPSFVSESKLGRYENAAIAAYSAPCASVGRQILEKNGSAVDAAIATMICTEVHEPHSMGLGGGFLMIYYNRTEQKTYYLDAREVAPLRATENMFEGNRSLASIGGLAIAVPGQLAGYAKAHKRFGRLPWSELFSPSIRICCDGFEVSRELAEVLANDKDILLKSEALKKVFLKNNGEPYEEGDVMKRPDLAKTLKTISRLKKDALYGSSEMARSFLRDINNAGSIISSVDMQRYKPRMRKPIKVALGCNYTLHSVSMPGGGPLLAFMLSILDGYSDMNGVMHNKASYVLAYHRIVETFKFAFAHRAELEDEDSDEVNEIIKKLLSREYADEIRQKIDDTRTFDDPVHYGAKSQYKSDKGTAHLSLVAPNGDAVSVTSSLNQRLGSKVLSPSTGILLNSHMDDFSSPNITNIFLLQPSSKNRIRPMKRPLSSISPVIFTANNGDVRIVLGSSGGSTILTGVLQVAARILYFGENVKEAIDAPRLHHQLLPNILDSEKNFSKPLLKELRKLGHKPRSWQFPIISSINSVTKTEGGSLFANADFRRVGGVDGF